jgi:hypothetical protein
MPEQEYSFAVDSFVIHNTRSAHRDTDYISASVAVAGRPALKATKKLGDLNNGTFHPAIGFKGVPVADNETAVFSYAIVNSGHKDPNTAEKMLEQAVSTLAEKGAQAAVTAAGGAIGSALGASIGTAVVPLVGTAIGALAGWVVSSAGQLLFADCDGLVAAAVHAYTGAQLRSGTSQGRHLGESDHPRDQFPPRLRQQFQLQRLLVDPFRGVILSKCNSLGAGLGGHRRDPSPRCQIRQAPGESRDRHRAGGRRRS